MSQQRPNLFAFATSELSQDAFIAWLVSWGDAAYRETDPVLHELARTLIGRLLQVAAVQLPGGYSRVEVNAQYKRIDLLVRLDDQAAIVIEDKVDSRQHSNQLERYRELIGDSYPADRVAYIYFKTGDQARYKGVDDAGFCVFHRRDFLEILRGGSEMGVECSIFTDYLGYLEEIELQFSSYRRLPADAEWSGRAWQGLFGEILDQLGGGDWGYVPNPQGGFMGLWWNWHPIGPEGREVYLQLEDNRLCYKVQPGTKDRAERAAVRRQWHEAVMAAASGSELGVIRPSRFGSGRYMTVALLPEYRRFGPDGAIDLAETMRVLVEAESIYERALTQLQQMEDERKGGTLAARSAHDRPRPREA